MKSKGTIDDLTRRPGRHHHRSRDAASGASTRCCSPREGAKVVVNDLGGANDGTGATSTPAQQVVAEIKAMGGEAVVNSDNVADWEGAQRLVNAAIEAFGDLDILVNNAGILRDRVLVNMTEDEWDAVIAVHLKGHFAPTRWAAAYWREQHKAGHGKPRNLVHTSSTSGLFSNPGQANYGAAKSGIATFSQIAPRSSSRYGVNSNCIAPGARTRLTLATPGLGDIMAPPRGRVRRVGSGQHLAARRLPGHGRLPVHRRDVLRPGRQRSSGCILGAGRDRRAAGPWTVAGLAEALAPLAPTVADRPDRSLGRSGGDRLDLLGDLVGDLVLTGWRSASPSSSSCRPAP